LPNKTLTPEQVLGLLAETPARIASLTAALSAAQLHSSAHFNQIARIVQESARFAQSASIARS